MSGASLMAVSAILTGYPSMPAPATLPTPPTVAVCQAWALSQDANVIENWGRQKNGTSSREIAVRRLTRSCMGGGNPQTVGFGSGAGFDTAYCRKHPRAEICRLS
jgi:hypothetical protein